MMAHPRYRNLFSCILILLAFTLSQSRSFAQQSDTARYFQETGHWVTDVFLQKYNEVPNPEFLYGFPITESFDAEVPPGSPQLRVQYFERARFEYQPEGLGLEVTLANIGINLYANRAPGESITTQPGLAACQFFSQTEHQICYAFLDFFNANGGVEQFGYPLSEVEIRDGRMMQYFQRARFEWHPERASGERVVLSDVGKIYFDMVENPYILLENNTASILMDLKVQAFVKTAVIGVDEEQTIYVIVQNQNYQPVPGAQVTFSLGLPEADAMFLMPATDANGISTLTFPVSGEPNGVIPITVTVNYNDHEKQTTTSYRIWW